MIGIERLRNIARRDASQSDAHIADGALTGIVTSLDPTTQTVKVRLEPSGVETGYLALKTPWAGNGWGMFAPPEPGTAVDVHFEDGDIDAGWVGLKAHNDADKPLPVPGGEFWLVHKSGLSLRLTNDGKVLLGGTATGSGIVMLGNTADLHALVKDTFMQLFNDHTHTAPNGATSKPLTPMTAAAHLTKEVKAS